MAKLENTTNGVDESGEQPEIVARGEKAILAAARKIRAKRAAEKEKLKWLRAAENQRKRDEAQAQREQEEIRKREEENLKRKKENPMALKIIDLGYRAMAARIHPDKGGTNEEMHELQATKQLLISCVEGASKNILDVMRKRY
jgi:hypothetical protein